MLYDSAKPPGQRVDNITLEVGAQFRVNAAPLHVTHAIRLQAPGTQTIKIYDLLPGHLPKMAASAPAMEKRPSLVRLVRSGGKAVPDHPARPPEKISPESNPPLDNPRERIVVFPSLGAYLFARQQEKQFKISPESFPPIPAYSHTFNYYVRNKTGELREDVAELYAARMPGEKIYITERMGLPRMRQGAWNHYVGVPLYFERATDENFVTCDPIHP